MIHSGSVAGVEVSFENGFIAKQGNGVLVRCGKAVVLCTACVGAEVSDGSFVPLSVHYIEKFSAAGKIPGGYLKREGKPTTVEVLASRLIDRALRPSINSKFAREIQVVCTVFSYDGTACDILALAGAVLALKLAGVPVEVIAASRINGDLINQAKGSESALDFVQVISRDRIIALEVGGLENSQEEIEEAQEKGFEIALQMLKIQEEFLKKVELPEELPTIKIKEEIKEIVTKYAEKHLKAIKHQDKVERRKEVQIVEEELFSHISEEDRPYARMLLKEETHDLLFADMLSTKKRLDGRDFDQLRQLDAQINLLPKAHGSALFSRGATQALVSVALAGQDAMQQSDSVGGENKEKFYLHYNFPPYSVGETSRLGAVGRREIGHGALAQKALQSLIPKEFDYVVRVITDITESDGSSSMASVCGASLALFAAGVPLKEQVAGISIGLIERSDEWDLLTDINGEEDAFGFMDFKVAATKNGITAIQVDVKNSGLTKEMFKSAIKRANKAISEILDYLNTVIKEPGKLSGLGYIHNLKIDPSKIGLLIGKAGATIKGICEVSKAKIHVSDDGSLQIIAEDEAGAVATVAKIEEAITKSFNRDRGPRDNREHRDHYKENKESDNNDNRKRKDNRPHYRSNESNRDSGNRSRDHEDHKWHKDRDYKKHQKHDDVENKNRENQEQNRESEESEKRGK